MGKGFSTPLNSLSSACFHCPLDRNTSATTLNLQMDTDTLYRASSFHG